MVMFCQLTHVRSPLGPCATSYQAQQHHWRSGGPRPRPFVSRGIPQNPWLGAKIKTLTPAPTLPTLAIRATQKHALILSPFPRKGRHAIPLALDPCPQGHGHTAPKPMVCKWTEHSPAATL